ncbi:hypothetical protein PV10_02878 [Exophiala mesophila]|uniref:Zn(2)-C6 fungal-type domain-containing protein n=1 Tax=Exophiala mesophila TaxID=212818 RepID=A0A0D1ZMJ3_EXOME|nr:uncharacterized protein PV10_02878 [Exophiala mesophila]KIV95199.1 hypothetical protein PV10_02878 [Exophiala mesophila]
MNLSNDASNSEGPEPVESRQKGGRRIACTACRQAKLRCLRSDTNSRTCIRCQKQARECVVDLEYKRLNKKERLNHLVQQQIKELQSANSAAPIPVVQHHPQLELPEIGNTDFAPLSNGQAGSHRSPSNSDLQTINSSRANTVTGTHSSVDQNPSYQTPSQPPMNTEYVPEETRRQSLDHVTLDPEQIDHLFDIYHRSYHPLFPILEPIPPPNLVFVQGPLLFWTIIAIASRQDLDDPSLKAALNPCVIRLLWQTVGMPPHSLRTLQAMSLICMWPFPTSSMSTDPTFILAGILKSAAVHIGLHQPEILQDYSRTKFKLGEQELKEAVKVWAGCYIAAENATTSTGQDSYFPSDGTIDRASLAENPYGLPRDLHHVLMIQHFCCKVHRTLNDSNYNRPERTFNLNCTHLLRVLEDELKSLEMSLGRQLSFHVQVVLLSARLQLQAYYLFNDTDSTERRLGVIKAYDTAIELILRIKAGDSINDFIRCAFGAVRTVSMIAAILIMKVIHSSYSSFINIPEGRRAFNAFLLLARQGSIEDNDLFGRANKILTQLWVVHRSFLQEQQKHPTLTHKSRSFFSVASDSLWLWRDRFGGQPDNGAPPLVRTIVHIPAPQSKPQAPKDTAGNGNALETPAASPNLHHNLTSPLQPDQWIAEPDQSTFPLDSLETGQVLASLESMQPVDQNWIWDLGFPSLSTSEFNMWPTNLGDQHANPGAR